MSVSAKISCHVPDKKKHTETVTSDMASPDWLKWRPFVCFARNVYLKISPFVTVLGQDRKLIEKHSYLIHSWWYTMSNIYVQKCT